MARSSLINPTEDLITDSGAILWSFVKGEQLEFPITLNFIENASVGYTYEAVVVEALNIANQVEKPTAIKPNGVQTNIFVRVPIYRGAWNASTAYNKEDVVTFNNKAYKLLQGSLRVGIQSPAEDVYWAETSLNKIYIQFLKTLGSTWELQATAKNAVYGFFELRVTEPSDSIFTRTWKPVRGMVEILFSPTDLVPDS
jgi:hypothetical protein